MTPSKTTDGVNPLMKIALTSCVGIIIGLVSSWFAMGGESITQKDLEHYDKNYSTWAKDKDIITLKLERVVTQNEKLIKIVEDLKFNQKFITNELKRIK